MPRNLERAVMANLISGSSGERFALRPNAIGFLRLALERDLLDHDPLDSLNAVLRLGAAFEEKLASPSIARMLRDLMRRTPDAVAILRYAEQRAKNASDNARAFARREGRSVPMRAAILDEPTPEGAVPLRSLIFTKGRIHGR